MDMTAFEGAAEMTELRRAILETRFQETFLDEMSVTRPYFLQHVDSPWTLNSPPTICLTDGSIKGACGPHGG